MIVFNGYTQAIEKESLLKSRVAELVARGGVIPAIAAVLFKEDSGSQLYTRLKSEAAQRVGIKYQVFEFSLTDSVEAVAEVIAELNTDTTVTGIIVQKPWRKMWLAANSGKRNEEYQNWWQSLMSAVDQSKDVDGLHPDTIRSVQAGTWREAGSVLPATCQAVLYALETAKTQLARENLGKTIIIGRTDLLGIPLYHVLQQAGVDAELLGIKELEERKHSGQFLLDAQVVVSATGQKHLITGEMVGEGVIVIDVGEPQPDVDRDTVEDKASFLTPVPGGIGPLTVSFLLENATILASKCR